MVRMIGFLRPYKRVIVFLLVFLVFVHSAFVFVDPGSFGRFYGLCSVALTVMLIASQVFWVGRVRELGKRVIPSKRWRWGLGAAGLIVYFFLLAYDVLTGEETFKGSSLTLRVVLLEAPFKLWMLGSLLGFLVAILLWIADRVARAVSWTFNKWIIPRRPELPSPDRRRFLKQTAVALTAAPFVAGVYGLFYGR